MRFRKSCGRIGKSSRRSCSKKIKDSEPLDYVKILQIVDEAREKDMEEFVGLLKSAVGKERLCAAAKYILAMKPMIVWNPERDFEPSIYILQRVLESMLRKKRGRKAKKDERR